MNCLQPSQKYSRSCGTWVPRLDLHCWHPRSKLTIKKFKKPYQLIYHMKGNGESYPTLFFSFFPPQTNHIWHIVHQMDEQYTVCSMSNSSIHPPSSNKSNPLYSEDFFWIPQARDEMARRIFCGFFFVLFSDLPTTWFHHSPLMLHYSLICLNLK